MEQWRALGASVTGDLHARGNRGCDDAHGWRIGESGLVLAVADGAGSRKLSGIGAHVAVAAVLQVSEAAGFEEHYAAEPAVAIRSLVEAAIDRIHTEAAVLEVAQGDLASTLCVAVLTADGATIAQVGDGVAVVELTSGTIQTVAQCERGEYANETVFITAPDAMNHLATYRTDAGDPVRSIALSTDGLRYKILSDLATGAPFRRFYQDSWNYARTEDASCEAIESWLTQVEDQTGDDLTLLLAVSEFVGTPGDRRRISPRPAPADTDRGSEGLVELPGQGQGRDE